MTDNKCIVKPLSLKPETAKNISSYSNYYNISHSHLVNEILQDIFSSYSKKQLLILFKPKGKLKLKN